MPPSVRFAKGTVAMDQAVTDPAVRTAGEALAHSWLRTLTAHAHARAEHAVMRALTPLGYERYASYLERVLALYAPLEERLWSAPALRDLLRDTDQRRKTPWLLEDLAALGRAPVLDGRAPELPALASPLEQLGAAYVVEGATLGGSVLLARLRGSGLLLDRNRGGARFLSGYGPETGARWHAFRSALREAACSRADWTAIGAGALATFRAFEAAISEAAQ
jgi:heme oxygenase